MIVFRIQDFLWPAVYVANHIPTTLEHGLTERIISGTIGEAWGRVWGDRGYSAAGEVTGKNKDRLAPRSQSGANLGCSTAASTWYFWPSYSLPAGSSSLGGESRRSLVYFSFSESVTTSTPF